MCVWVVLLWRRATMIRPDTAKASTVVRVVSCRDVAQPPSGVQSRHRAESSSRRRILLLDLTDGTTDYCALERSVLPFEPQPGDELQLHTSVEVLGVILLEPGSCTLLRSSPRPPDTVLHQPGDWKEGDVDAADRPPAFTQLGSHDDHPRTGVCRAAAPTPAALGQEGSHTMVAVHCSVNDVAIRQGRAARGAHAAAGGAKASETNAAVHGLSPALVAELLAAGLTLEEIAAHAT